jgi:hypothetical protein
MAVTKEFASGTIIAITAKATISSGDPTLLQYSWYKDNTLLFTVLTDGVSNILTATAGTYYVVVSHPDADPVTSESFILTLRDPVDILRIVYQTVNSNRIDSSGNFTSYEIVDWNIARQQYEFGPDANNGFNTPSSGWWRIFAKERNVSLDITMRGSKGSGSNPGLGGVGTLRRTFEQNQVYTFRVGDDNTTNSDVQLNGPNGGRIGSGSGGLGGGCTYMLRGGTVTAIVGGGGGSSSTGLKGGDGGGFNVAGENGFGSNGGRGGAIVPPGEFGIPSGYASSPNVTITMTKCTVLSNNTLNCDADITGNQLQNNGAFGFNGAGAGGSGVTGGFAGQDSNGAGGGGSGWASSAVTVLQKQLGGNTVSNRRGSVRIRKTGFVNYIASWYHTTGVRVGFTPVFNYTNTGNFIATIIPQNEGTASTAYNQLPENHYLIKFQEPFLDTNYVVDFTFISTTISGVSGIILPNMKVSFFERELGQCRVWFTGDDIGNVHVREAAFRIY